ncbi:MAG: AAA family ATPase [Bacteroidota bacterium]
MMIKELHLENWKSFKKSRLYIDPLTILIGRNASGKSNVLDALSLLQSISSGNQITQSLNGTSESTGVRGGVNWMIKQGESSCKIGVTVKGEEELIEYFYEIELGILENRAELLSECLYRVRLRKTNTNKSYKKLFHTDDRDISKPSIIAYFSTNTQGRGKRFELRRSYSILSQSRSLSLIKDVAKGVNTVVKHLQRIFVYDPIPSLMRDYSPLNDALLPDGSNISGVLAAIENGRRKEVEHQLAKYFKLIPEKDVTRVYTELVGKFGADAMLYVEENWKNITTSVDAKGMSDGTLRFIAIMVALLTLKEGSLLVIEEIDNGLHPSRSDVLVKIINEIGLSRNIDVVCTTHNPSLLNAFGNEIIPFVSYVYRDDLTGDSCIKLLEEIEELPRLLGAGKIGTLMSKGLFEKVL